MGKRPLSTAMILIRGVAKRCPILAAKIIRETRAINARIPKREIHGSVFVIQDLA